MNLKKFIKECPMSTFTLSPAVLARVHEFAQEIASLEFEAEALRDFAGSRFFEAVVDAMANSLADEAQGLRTKNPALLPAMLGRTAWEFAHVSQMLLCRANAMEAPNREAFADLARRIGRHAETAGHLAQTVLEEKTGTL